MNFKDYKLNNIRVVNLRLFNTPQKEAVLQKKVHPKTEGEDTQGLDVKGKTFPNLEWIEVPEAVMLPNKNTSCLVSDFHNTEMTLLQSSHKKIFECQFRPQMPDCLTPTLSVTETGWVKDILNDKI